MRINGDMTIFLLPKVCMLFSYVFLFICSLEVASVQECRLFSPPRKLYDLKSLVLSHQNYLESVSTARIVNDDSCRAKLCLSVC